MTDRSLLGRRLSLVDADLGKNPRDLRFSAFICVLILYQPTDGSPYPSGSYAVVPVGSQYADGTWRELRRDLDADLRSVFGVGVEQVLGIYIRGDYDLDELTLIGREERSTYYAAGARVAMRVDDGGGSVIYSSPGRLVLLKVKGLARRS